MSEPSNDSGAKRRTFLITLVWVLLILKGIILTWASMSFDTPLRVSWVWLTVIPAALIFTFVLKREGSPPPSGDEKKAEE